MKLIDLTGTLENGMWDYGEPFTPFSIERISDMEKDGYVASRLVLTTHTGTHIDCPRHFGEERTSVEKMDLSNFIGNALLLDVSADCGEFTQIGEDMLRKAGAEELSEDDICVMKTGWSKNWNRPGYADNYPQLTVSGAEYLVNKGIKLFATDIPVIGDPHSTDTDMVLCRKEIPSIYALVDLDLLPKRFEFIAMPLKIKNGDGSPVRAVAMVEE